MHVSLSVCVAHCDETDANDGGGVGSACAAVESRIFAVRRYRQTHSVTRLDWSQTVFSVTAVRVYVLGAHTIRILYRTIK